MQFDISYDARNVTQWLRRLLGELPGGMSAAVREGAELVKSDMRVRLNYPRGSYMQRAPVGYLGARTTELMNSIAVIMHQTPFGVAATVSPTGARNRMLANVHERGAVIRPRHAQYLKIPLPAAMDSRGVELTNLPGPQFVFRSRRGNLLIGYRAGSGVRPLFVLKTMVRIPARRMFEVESIAVQPQLNRLFNHRVASWLART